MKTVKSGMLAAALILTANTTVFAEEMEVFKWTDEKGVIHYSQRQPEGVDSQVITAKTSSVETSSAPTNTGNPKEEGVPGAEPAPEVVKKDPRICKQAKENLQTLKTIAVVRQKGKVMSMDEKNAEIQNLNEIIKVHC